MTRAVRYKLSGNQLKWALKFSDDLGMPLDEAARRALLLAITQAYPNVLGKHDGEHNTTTGVSQGDTPPDHGSASGSSPLAEARDLASDTK